MRRWITTYVLPRCLYMVRMLPEGRVRHKLEILARPIPRGRDVGCRAKRLNQIASSIPGCSEYLEIGVQFGFTISGVQVKNKTGVDPYPMFNPYFAEGIQFHACSSDDFFSQLDRGTKFDLIFLDGLHTFEQTARDFLNSLRHLKPGGVIVIDDVVPNSREKAIPDRQESVRQQLLKMGEADGEWYGDVWKLPVAVDELFAGVLKVETVGYGPCGQSVVRSRTDWIGVTEVDETALLRFSNLAYEDYFPKEASPLLPGYSSET